MADRRVKLQVNPNSSTLIGDTVVNGLLYVESEDSIVLDLPPGCFVNNLAKPLAVDPRDANKIKLNGAPRGKYTFEVNVLNSTNVTLAVVVGRILDVTVHHTPSGCTLSGATVREQGGDYIVHSQRFDLIRFALVSSEPDLKWDDPPLIWNDPEKCKTMCVQRILDTLFYVGDDGSAGGEFAFKLDVDKFTLTGRVHCKDDPSILNDNPP